MNKKMKFTKWWNENILEEYKNKKENYFLDDNWFVSLPKTLQDIILKFDDNDIDNLNFEWNLIDLECEIKEYLAEYKHWNYNDEEVKYLFEYLDFLQLEDIEKENKEMEYGE